MSNGEDQLEGGKGNAPPELALDNKETSGFIAWFRKLPQVPQLVRLFDRKGYYSVHGEDALFVARTFYKTTAVVKYLGGNNGGLASVTLNRNLCITVLRELLVEGADHSVELWEGTGASWKVARQASPGRLSAFEEELFGGGAEMTDAPVVIAVSLTLREGVREVGLAYADVSTRRLGAAAFVDDELLTGLEAAVVQLGAKEAVICKDEGGGPAGSGGSGGTSDAAGARRLGELLERCGAMASARPRSFFSPKHLEADLAKLAKSGSVEHHADVLERSAAKGPLAAVIAFCEILADSAGHGKWEIGLYDSRQYMRLDAAAQRALNVFPSRTDASSTFSLYGLLNRGRTPMGKRRLRVWLKQPLVSVADIQARHDVVGALVEDAELRERLRDAHLRGLPDVERLARKLDSRRNVNLADLCSLYRASARLPLIEEALRGHAGPAAGVLVARYANPLGCAHDSDHLSKFEELVEAAVDLDRVPDEFLVAPAYDTRLAELAKAKESAERAIARLATAAADDLGLTLDKQLKLEWHKAANLRTRCLRITQKDEKAVRSKLQAKYKTLQTSKDGVRFTSKALEAEAVRLQEASSQYEEVQRELVEQVVAVAHTFVGVWETVGSLLAELDVLAGFADLAARAPAPYVRPTLLPAPGLSNQQPCAASAGAGPGQQPQGQQGPGDVEMVDGSAAAAAPGQEVIDLRGCRHPCVEAQEGVEFIKNDCVMTKGQSWFTLITGPNMGGKSTYIRQVGCCVLLAQVGCFVPADSATLSVRDAIFARVGAGDCQQRGVSTFMAEMLETAAILKGATSSSLVIIDELGRGTSTYDGFGLAWAIGEHLMEVTGAPTLFATHFHELTDIQGPTGVRNLHVSTSVDPATGRLTMLYRLREGPCDQSFGIQVAESAGFPSSVVSLARERLAQLEGSEAEGLKAIGGKRKASGPPEGEEGQERQTQVQAAAQRARTFLSEFAALPLLAEDGQQAPAAADGDDQANNNNSGAARASPFTGKLNPDALQRAGQLLKALEEDAAGNPFLKALLPGNSA